MDKDKILETLQQEFYTTLSVTKHSTLRDYAFPEAKNMIKVAIGMRRSGKTYFLFQTINQLLKLGLKKENFLYLNFEDDRLLPLSYKDMGELIDRWYSLNTKRYNQICYLFFDEVQNIEGWPLVLRRLQDTKNIQIYVTGSSAKLLSKEIATSLRGRSLNIEIFPYSYKEFLTTHDKKFPPKSFGKKMYETQRNYLLTYFAVGGFPAVQHMNPNEHLDTLQNYVETVIFRDVIERYQIENRALMKYLIQGLLKNISSRFSVTKFYNDIKSQGYKVGKDTLYAYMSYLEDAFLIFTVPLFSESLRKKHITPKKIYAIDNGLVTANTFNFSPNLGKLLENLVYLDLRRQRKEIFYYVTLDGYEIDFITKDKQGKHEILQIVWDATDNETLERETRALEQAKKELMFTGRLIDWKTYLRDLCITSFAR